MSQLLAQLPPQMQNTLQGLAQHQPGSGYYNGAANAPRPMGAQSYGNASNPYGSYQ